MVESSTPRSEEWAAAIRDAYVAFGVDPLDHPDTLGLSIGTRRMIEYWTPQRRSEAAQDRLRDPKTQQFLPDPRADLSPPESPPPQEPPHVAVREAADAFHARITATGGFGMKDGEPDPAVAQQHLDELIDIGRQVQAITTELLPDKLPDRVGFTDESLEGASDVARRIEKRHRDAQDLRLQVALDTLEKITGRAEPMPGTIGQAQDRGTELAEQDVNDPDAPGKHLRALTDEEAQQIDEAVTRYPAAWRPALEGIMSDTYLLSGTRAFFGKNAAPDGNHVLNMSSDLTQHGAPINTMVHEIGHSMEYQIPGLIAAEDAYWKKRVGPDRTLVANDGGHFPKTVAEPVKAGYSLKRYKGATGTAGIPLAEMFTTGAEDILGSGARRYTDPEFEAFIWGSLITFRP